MFTSDNKITLTVDNGLNGYKIIYGVPIEVSEKKYQSGSPLVLNDELPRRDRESDNIYRPICIKNRCIFKDSSNKFQLI